MPFQSHSRINNVSFENIKKEEAKTELDNSGDMVERKKEIIGACCIDRQS